jgi:hypothetical protein
MNITTPNYNNDPYEMIKSNYTVVHSDQIKDQLVRYPAPAENDEKMRNM